MIAIRSAVRSANELCYPEDAGLSRQHLALEKDGDTWMVRDLGSKNGTFVNGVRITSPYPLGKNDRVTAGHIALDFGENSLPPPSDNTVIFIEGDTPTTSVSTTVATSLKGVLEPGEGDRRRSADAGADSRRPRAGRATCRWPSCSSSS